MQENALSSSTTAVWSSSLDQNKEGKGETLRVVRGFPAATGDEQGRVKKDSERKEKQTRQQKKHDEQHRWGLLVA